MTDTQRPLHLAASTWMRETGIRLANQDGWAPEFDVRFDLPHRDFEDPITRHEFMIRAKWCEALRWPDPPFDERPVPPDEFVSRLAEALKSEFGVQFGMGINAPDEEWKRVARGIALKMRCQSAEIRPLFNEDSELWFGFSPRESE